MLENLRHCSGEKKPGLLRRDVLLEDGRRDEIVKRKRLAVEAVKNDAYGSEAEADEADEEPQEMTPAEIVQIPDPKAMLNEETGVHIFLQFRFSFIFIFVNIIYNSKIQKYIFS